jgi:DNA-binding transcriptional regulator YbjK
MTATAALSLPRAEQRRRAILAATLRVIATGGVDAVTHRRVAAKAGVSLSSTTYHFDTRDDLIAEAFEHYIAEANELIGSVSTGSVKSLEDAVDFAMDYARREFADPELLQAEYELILYATRAPRVRKAFLAWQRGIESMMAEILEHLGISQPLKAARTLSGLIRAFELELRWRLELFAGALHADRADAPAVRKSKG